SVTDKGSTTIQVNLLSCFITTAPLFVASEVPDDIWSNFKEVYDQSYPDPPLVAPSIFKPFVVNPLKFLSILSCQNTSSASFLFAIFDVNNMAFIVSKYMERCVVHLDLDTFFVSVERLQNSSLVGKPVLIGGGSDRGVVASCSYEARRFGVHSAMPMKLARQLCPEAVLIRGDMDRYSMYSSVVTEIISETAPVVEKASIDEHYVDLTGMDRFFGC